MQPQIHAITRVFHFFYLTSFFLDIWSSPLLIQLIWLIQDLSTCSSSYCCWRRRRQRWRVWSRASRPSWRANILGGKWGSARPNLSITERDLSVRATKIESPPVAPILIITIPCRLHRADYDHTRSFIINSVFSSLK